MRRNRRWVLHLLHHSLLELSILVSIFPLRSAFSPLPVLILIVLAWSRGFFLISTKVTLESLYLRGEACIRFDKLDSKLV